MIHRRNTQETGQVLVMLLILTAMAAGGVWYLFHSRNANEKAARDFAQHAAERILLAQDMRFLDTTLSRDAQLLYPPSFRERLIARVRDLGPPDAQEVRVTGEVTFTSNFFDPRGSFRGETTFSGRLAYVTFRFSRPAALWKIDALNFTWHPAPAPPALPEDFPPPPEWEPRFVEETPTKKQSRRRR